MSSEDINEIIPYLFISNWNTSNNPNVIKKYNIKAVITLETIDKPKDIIDFYKNNNIDFMYIRLYDDPNSDISKYHNPIRTPGKNLKSKWRIRKDVAIS